MTRFNSTTRIGHAGPASRLSDGRGVIDDTVRTTNLDGVLPILANSRESSCRRVAFTGKLASGKSTAARFLVDRLGFTRIALADELKSLAADIANWMHRERLMPHEDRVRLLDKTTPVGRRWLQWLGTEGLRSRLSDAWILMLLGKVESLGPAARVVTDDVRFLNEATSLSIAGYKVVKIEVPEPVRLERIRINYPQYQDRWLAEIASHPSEIEVDIIHPHLVIEAKEGLEEFSQQVVEAVSGLISS